MTTFTHKSETQRKQVSPVFVDIADAEILASDHAQKVLDDRAIQSEGKKDIELRRKLLALSR